MGFEPRLSFKPRWRGVCLDSARWVEDVGQKPFPCFAFLIPSSARNENLHRRRTFTPKPTRRCRSSITACFTATGFRGHSLLQWARLPAGGASRAALGFGAGDPPDDPDVAGGDGSGDAGDDSGERTARRLHPAGGDAREGQSRAEPGPLPEGVGDHHRGDDPALPGGSLRARADDGDVRHAPHVAGGAEPGGEVAELPQQHHGQDGGEPCQARTRA